MINEHRLYNENEKLTAENAELQRKGEQLCWQNGNLLMIRAEFIKACEQVIKLIDNHQAYDKGAKQLLQNALHRANEGFGVNFNETSK